uniref:Malectin-like domain-containing protein n=1 Tax=Salix viminalis TaxID=40686 RepID=A0A6N2N2X2_SALVM
MSSSSYKYLYLNFLFLHLTILVTGNLPQPYLPLDNIALDCGSSSESFVNHRNWTADISSKVALLDQDRGSKKSTANQASTHPVPYYTDPLGARGYAREFILNVEDEMKNLSITFTPSPHVADAYAFINGIEIVSMPTNLYYTAGDDKGLHDVGKDGAQYALQKETALEMMYRLNVGGTEIIPLQDNMPFKKKLLWTACFVGDYLTDARPSAYQFNGTIQLQYNNHTRYAAPEDLYRTARSMGPDGTVNEKYNMTWEFPVHSSFTYLVRLHFCQIIPIILRKGDQAFEIYIANKTAERYADIIDWAGGNGVPIYKDYAVMMHARGIEELQNLSIALHPSPQTFQFSDAMLNGVEIFKLSNSDNLSGPNPGSYQDSPTSATSSKPKLFFAVCR